MEVCVLPDSPLPIPEEMHLPATEAIGTSSLILIDLSKAAVRAGPSTYSQFGVKYSSAGWKRGSEEVIKTGAIYQEQLQGVDGRRLFWI